MHLVTARPVYRRLFDFWLKIFGVAFGMGVVSGIVMGFEFGTNWSRLAEATGPIQGPLITYETFTAFALEASFFGVLIFGRPRVSPVVYFFSTLMVALGTTFSAFWIMVNNSWMQAPVGYQIQDGVFVPTDWAAIIFSPVVWVRFPHMLIAAYLTGAFCVAATGAWYKLRNSNGGPGDVTDGAIPGRSASARPVIFRAPQRRICSRFTAGEVRCNRGTLA
jgi:cytochrome d ubiquinol oxidase subunit I